MLLKARLCREKVAWGKLQIGSMILGATDISWHGCSFVHFNDQFEITLSVEKTPWLLPLSKVYPENY